MPNGITSSYTFDANGSLSDLHYRKEDDGSTVQRFQYTYDKNGMRTSMTDNDGTHDYAYDALYQITRATHPTVQKPVAELVEAEQFQYDEVGNWLKDNRVHNELNQLIEDDSCFYQYDFDGNITRKIIKSTDDTTEFNWDIENKLVDVKKKGLVVQYEYDALGRRATKRVDAITTEFRYDGDDLILEMNDSDSVIANYTFGPGIDNPLAMHRNDKDYYYLKDALGSVTELTDSTGNVVKEYRYSVFGKIVKESGDMVLWNPFTFTSREWDKCVELYYCRNRYYNASIGRFISEDPMRFLGRDVNLYRYVNNSPSVYLDPFGLWQITIGGGYGIAGQVTFGYNQGRWNAGGGIGFGIGFGATIDPADVDPNSPNQSKDLCGESNSISSVSFGLEMAGGIGIGDKLGVEGSLGIKSKSNNERVSTDLSTSVSGAALSVNAGIQGNASITGNYNTGEYNTSFGVGLSAKGSYGSYGFAGFTVGVTF